MAGIFHRRGLITGGALYVWWCLRMFKMRFADYFFCVAGSVSRAKSGGSRHINWTNRPVFDETWPVKVEVNRRCHFSHCYLMSDLQEQEVRVDVVESVKAIKGTQLLCSILLGLSTSCLCVLFFLFFFDPGSWWMMSRCLCLGCPKMSPMCPTCQSMEVSWNRGTPKSSMFNGIFPYKPSGYWGTPIYGHPHVDNFRSTWNYNGFSMNPCPTWRIVD